MGVASLFSHLDRVKQLADLDFRRPRVRRAGPVAASEARATGAVPWRAAPADPAALAAPHARGLHSFTSQLNLSALNGIGGARRGCVARAKGVLGGVEGVQGVFVCRKRLKLS